MICKTLVSAIGEPERILLWHSNALIFMRFPNLKNQLGLND